MMSTFSLAQTLEVIHDNGKSLPISDYLSSNQPSDEDQANKNKANKGRVVAPTMNFFPVRTDAMTPGMVVPREIDLSHFHIPLFMVGSDIQSQQWLVSRREELIELNALGLLIAVDNESDFHTMITLAKGLWLFPASGQDIARELSLTHYPVLISKHGIEQ